MTRQVNLMRALFFILFSFSSILTFSQGKWKIAYVHWKDTVIAENWINTMDMEGDNIQTIIDYPGSNWMPMASRDKIWFQVDKDTAGKKKGLYIYDIKRKKEKYLFEAKGLYQDIDYDKRSKQYTGGFSHKPGNAAKSQYDIFLFNEDGTGKVQVTNDTAIDLEPVFSSDGRKIIFRSNRDRNPLSWAEFDIYSINRDGTGIRRLTFNPDTTRNVLRSSSPIITPDGRIAYSAYWNNTYRIMVMNTDGTEIRPLMAMDDMEQMSCHFSPDGKHVVFAGRKKSARNFDIYLADINGNNLRQLTHDWKRKVQPFFIRFR